MVSQIYLGNPPDNIKAWIQEHSQPASHPETRFTLEGGIVETHNITGTLDQQWMIDNGFFNEDDWEWTKTITQVDIGNTVTSIGNSAFYSCSMTNVTIPDSVTGIENHAFYECRLMSVTIPDSVKSIGSFAFFSCSRLMSMTIGNSVMNIREAAFVGCSSLTNVTFEGKDKVTVQGMTNYPFGLDYANKSGVTIHCTDGDIPISHAG